MASRGWLLTGNMTLVAGLIACGGDSQGLDFTPVPGVTGKLAYVGGVNRNGYIQYELRVLDLQTGGTRTIYTTPRSEFISSITWHPGGHSLVIATGNISSGDYRLRRLNEDGTGLTSLFDGNGPEFGAAYSPQGALAYCAEIITDPQAPVVEGLFVSGALTWPGICGNTAPSWFPDGSAVALVANVGGSLGLYRIDLSTKTPTLIVAAPAPGGLFEPAVSPQGDVIAVTAADASGEEIWLIRADGSGSTVLPSGRGGNAQWSPDASRILFVRGFRPYVHELGTGTVEKITDTEMLTIAWNPD